MLGLGQRIGGARHVFHAAGDENIAFTGADGTRGLVDGSQARSAQPVDGDAGHFNREAGEQQRHARHVAVIFAGLVGTAQVHFLNQRRVQLVTQQDRFQHMGSQVVGADGGQSAAQRADGGADRINDNGLGHRYS